MKYFSRLIFTCCLIVSVCSGSIAQRHKVDSLLHVVGGEKEDSNKVNTLISLSARLLRMGQYDSSVSCAGSALALGERLDFKRGTSGACNNLISGYRHLNRFDEAIAIGMKALEINRKRGNPEGMASNLGNMGLVYWNQGRLHQALDNYVKALAINKEIKSRGGMVSNLSNMGIIYSEEGNYPKALELMFESLKLNENGNNDNELSNTYGNIGNIYDQQGNYAKALEYDQKALDFARKAEDKSGVVRHLGNIGNIYFDQKKFKEALDYDFQALTMAREIKDLSSVARNLSNIGIIYKDQGDYAKGVEYYKQAVSLTKEIGDLQGLSNTLSNLGSAYIHLKNFPAAQSALDSALSLSHRTGDKEDIKNAYLNLAALDSVMGRFKEGWEHFKYYFAYKDSLINEASTKKTIEAEMNFGFEQKQAAEKAEQDKKDLLAAQDKSRQLVIRNSFIGGFALMLLLAFFIFRGYRQKQKANVIITRQKEEVEHQKALVEEKNKDILDSITYAKRLQEAILPPRNLVRQYLPESFILYKPKDIVAGDFYWMEKTGDLILLAAADCTGHGVPGALVSVVCSNALNRTVKEFQIHEPGQILDKVRELVLQTFEKSESSVQDGMDISLCSINTRTKEIRWSGANNPLWYIQQGGIKELNPNKQPIGKHDAPVPFLMHTIQLQSGDSLFLFTDGYADQFGGSKGKKFKYKQLQEKLLSLSGVPMRAQDAELEKTLHAWKGNLEQVDDILIVGVCL